MDPRAPPPRRRRAYAPLSHLRRRRLPRPADARLRATLAASQLVGLAMVRYVVRVEPLASADHDTIVAALAPTIERYLTAELS